MRKELLMATTLATVTLCGVRTPADDMIPADVPSLVARQDVFYLSPARQGWEGLPLGNGTLGAMVWQPEALTFQLNTPLSGVYNGAICRVHLRPMPGILTGLISYRARLSLFDATLTLDIRTDSGPVTLTCFIPATEDALVVTVDDRRSGDPTWIAEIEHWRKTATVAAASDGTPVFRDVLRVQGEPDYRFAVALAARAKAQTAVGVAGPAALQLRTGSFTLCAGFAGTRDPAADVAAAASERATRLAGPGLAAARTAHTAWWSAFWARSWVRLGSADGAADYLANLWYMHLYAMASGSRGEVPPKFNGGLWTADGDNREWGGAFWHWNTQESYWPLYASDHLELLQPYQKMYWDMLPAVRKWTRETWETDGAQFQETIPFNGAMGVWEKARGAHPRLPTPKQIGYTNLILSSSGEIAMQFWWHYLYTGDREFLRDRAYPLMLEVATFYANYLEKDAAGHYVMAPSNAHETFWNVRNPTPDLAAIRYVFPALLEAARILGIDPGPQYAERLAQLAPYAINSLNGAIRPYELRPGEEIKITNAENPDLFPIGVFPLITLGSPDYKLGLATFHARAQVNVYGWTTDSIAAARLGLADAAPAGAPPQSMGLEQLLPQHAELYQNYPCGLQDYYGRKPGAHPYLEGSGAFATAVNEMLLQGWNGVIRVCPALPKAWDADFQLLAPGGFEVAAHAEAGRVSYLTVRSRRGEPLVLANPFTGAARVQAGGKDVLTSAEPLLKFPTTAGTTYVVTPAGVDFHPARVSATPNDGPKHMSRASKRWIGRTELGSAAWKPPVEKNAPQPPVSPPAIERPAKPEIRPAWFPTPPVIDGTLTDPAWATATALGPMLRLAQPGPAGQPTEVRLGYDAQALYIGITCWEARMDRIVAEFTDPPAQHDAALFTDDSVELFLEPAPGLLWHLAVNVFGVTYDARGLTADTENKALNPPWQAAVTRASNRWVCEVRIPLDSLVPYAPAAGDAWGFNVCRNEKPAGEVSTWAPLSQPRFHLPAEFARLVFERGAGAAPEPIRDATLLGHWTFEGVGGCWVPDVSGHRHPGLLTAPMKAVDGKRGKALEFTGAGFVDIGPAADLNVKDALTLAAWILPRATGAMRLIDKGPAGGSDAYMLDTHPENNLRFVSRIATLGAPGVKLPEGQWAHVAAVVGSGHVRLYLNGKQVAEQAAAMALTPSDLPLRLGAASHGGDRFVGLMEDVRVYSRALSAEEIGALAGDAKAP